MVGTAFAGPNLSNHRTYIVNGLASAIPNIGYGLRNLHKKLGGEYYAYLTPVEASGAEYNILRSIRKEYRKNPNININLVGVSYGGNIVTWIAKKLAYQKIPVNYLAVIDAPAPSSISANVHRVDNFTCRRIGCIGMKLRRAIGNKETIFNSFRYKKAHIRLPNDKRLQRRIVSQLTDTPLFQPEDFFEPEEVQQPDGLSDPLFGDGQVSVDGVLQPGVSPTTQPQVMPSATQ